MKNVILVLSFLVLINFSFAQTRVNNQDERKIYVNPQVLASFPGGGQAWQKFLTANLDTNVGVKNGAPSGTYTVKVRFIVEMDGAVSDVTCENDPKYGMCQEAIGMVKKSGRWKPATYNGRIVNSFKSLPIVFNVQ
jgi:periplasmic protein TonB